MDLHEAICEQLLNQTRARVDLIVYVEVFDQRNYYGSEGVIPATTMAVVISCVWAPIGDYYIHPPITRWSQPLPDHHFGCTKNLKADLDNLEVKVNYKVQG
ncbi:hypothetical protein SLE2022_137320 [Rubroshorea leprosula]